MTVLPGGGGYVGNSIDSWTGTTVGYGTLPGYRRLDEAVSMRLHVGEVHVRLFDNFATIEREADSPGTAYRTAAQTMDRLLRHLSLTQGRLFEWRPVSLTSPDGRAYAIPGEIRLASVTTYDLDTLKADLEAAAGFADVVDERLMRAMDYYEQALLLFERRAYIVRASSAQHTRLISAVFLDLWKALTTVVGDPSRDSDHQSRYRALGLDHSFYETRIKRLHELRNEYDVAHSSLDERATQRIEAEFGEARNTVDEVLRRYRASLAAPGSEQRGVLGLKVPGP